MGILLALMSAVLASSKDIFNKSISSALSGNLSAFTSFLFALPFYLALLTALWLLGLENFEVQAGFLLFVALRAIADTFAEAFKMNALHHGELSLVSSIIALYPLFVLALSPMITGDLLTSRVILGVLLVVGGNAVLFYRSEVTLSRRAVLFALGSALFMSLNICFDRMSAQRASPVVSAFAMTLISCLLLMPTLWWERNSVKLVRSTLTPLWWRGAFEVGFMVLKLWALQTLTSAELAAILRVSLIFTVIGGRLVFKELNFTRKIVGAALTSLGIVLVVLKDL